jgi:hypothetical protein
MVMRAAGRHPWRRGGRARALLPMSGGKTGGAVPPTAGPCGSVRVAEYRLDRRAHGCHQQRFGRPGAIPFSGGLPLNQADEEHPTAHGPPGEGQPQDRTRQISGRGLVRRDGCLANRQRNRNLTPLENTRRPQLTRRLRPPLCGQAIPPRHPSFPRTGSSRRSTSFHPASEAPKSPVVQAGTEAPTSCRAAVAFAPGHVPHLAAFIETSMTSFAYNTLIEHHQAYSPSNMP